MEFSYIPNGIGISAFGGTGPDDKEIFDWIFLFKKTPQNMHSVV